MNSKGLIKNVVLGAAAGLTATYLMTKFQAQAGKLESSIKDKKPEEENKKKQDQQDSEPSTLKLANKLSETIVHHPVPKKQQETASNLVHYGFGTSLGALFALIEMKQKKINIPSGLGYGVLVWAVADNILVPLMGLSKGPLQQSLKTQTYALSSHLVYGAALSSLLKYEQRFMQ